MKPIKNVLVIDIGGTHVKVLATGQDARREFDSGPALTPKRMVSEVRKFVSDWKYQVVSIGYPGPSSRTGQFRNRGTSAKGGSVSTSKLPSNVQSRS